MWINSLLSADLRCTSLLGDALRDGYVLLRAIDAISPGLVQARTAQRSAALGCGPEVALHGLFGLRRDGDCPWSV
jgi:hypothetical protein